jgi:8-oxo-dGTP pyrophosphatase MutT (NUDIX family)
VSEIESVGVDIKWEGRILTVGVERFRHPDDGEITREKVWHPGAVAMLAIDDEYVWLTRQPREAVGESSSLEVPAGKLDVEGESPALGAARELSEEIGKRAANWEQLMSFYTSPGFSDERIYLYLATGLSDDPDGHPEEGERIEIVPWRRDRLDDAIAECEDSKSLIALLWLKGNPGR